jgi:PucR family transcriptional regulator, purine catabolism regulatory protein
VVSVAVEQATHLFALSLIHQRSAGLGGRFARSRLLADLLCGSTASELLEFRAASLGVDLDIPYTVLLATPPTASPADAVLARSLAALPPEPAPLVDLVGERLIALLPGADRARALQNASHLAALLGPGGPVVAGDTVAHGDIAAAYSESRRLLDAVERSAAPSDPRRVIDAAATGVVGVLVRAGSETGFDAFWRGRIASLADHDAREGTDLCGTVAAFLETASARAAAQRLGVHPNSVAARLRRAESVGAFSLDRPADRLELDLALRCRRLLGL